MHSAFSEIVFRCSNCRQTLLFYINIIYVKKYQWVFCILGRTCWKPRSSECPYCREFIYLEEFVVLLMNNAHQIWISSRCVREMSFICIIFQQTIAMELLIVQFSNVAKSIANLVFYLSRSLIRSIKTPCQRLALLIV